MRDFFIDSEAETRDDFLKLVGSSRVTFYEVYDGTPNADIEQLLVEKATDELLLRFDMSLHTSPGRARFCSLSDFERKGYGLPRKTPEMPMPYFSAYLLGYGRVDVAWTRDEVEMLIVKTREERDLVTKINAGHFR